MRTTLFLLSLVTAACGSNEGQPATPTTPLSSGGAGPTAAAGTATTSGVGTMATGGAGASPVVPATSGAAGSAVTPGAGTAGTAAAGSAGTGGAAGMGGSPQAGTGGGADAGAGGTVADDSLFTVASHLASDDNPSAPGTIGIVTWSSTLGAIADAQIEFGLDDTYGMTAPVDLNEPEYRTLLLGMKPANTYHFRIVAGDGTTSYASGDYTIDTGSPTNLINLASFDVVNEAGRERGFIVSSYWQGQSGSVPFVVDADGEIVWWYESNTNGIARARMSADGKNMWIIPASNGGGPLERVSMDTLDGQVYNNTTGSHDLTPVTGDLMAYLDYGENDCNSIFTIDPSGTTEEIWDSDTVFGGGGGGGGFGGGCHSNALRYSATEDVYTLSDVNQDVAVVSRTGELQWLLTDIVSQGNSAWGGTQHGHQLLSDSILIFANNGGQGQASRAIEYTLDGQEIMSYESGDYSANLGDVQRLPGGNTLVTFSNDTIIHEIDANAQLVLEIDGGNGAFGYALWRESLYGTPPDIGL